jgi:hypothetical protein
MIFFRRKGILIARNPALRLPESSVKGREVFEADSGGDSENVCQTYRQQD